MNAILDQYGGKLELSTQGASRDKDWAKSVGEAQPSNPSRGVTEKDSELQGRQSSPGKGPTRRRTPHHARQGSRTEESAQPANRASFSQVDEPCNSGASHHLSCASTIPESSAHSSVSSCSSRSGLQQADGSLPDQSEADTPSSPLSSLRTRGSLERLSGQFRMTRRPHIALQGDTSCSNHSTDRHPQQLAASSSATSNNPNWILLSSRVVNLQKFFNNRLTGAIALVEDDSVSGRLQDFSPQRQRKVAGTFAGLSRHTDQWDHCSARYLRLCLRCHVGNRQACRCPEPAREEAPGVRAVRVEEQSLSHHGSGRLFQGLAQADSAAAGQSSRRSAGLGERRALD